MNIICCISLFSLNFSSFINYKDGRFNNFLYQRQCKQLEFELNTLELVENIKSTISTTMPLNCIILNSLNNDIFLKSECKFFYITYTTLHIISTMVFTSAHWNTWKCIIFKTNLSKITCKQLIITLKDYKQ